tara:strand:- start:2950 stop:3123 length:174 start_codon:yes stop_codon:yes gene_type:complete
VAKNKQQQKRLNDEEQMNQNQMNNASKKILVVDDIGLCRRVRFRFARVTAHGNFCFG